MRLLFSLIIPKPSILDTVSHLALEKISNIKLKLKIIPHKSVLKLNSLTS